MADIREFLDSSDPHGNNGRGERIWTSAIASDMPAFGTTRVAQVAKHVAQRPDHEIPIFVVGVAVHLKLRRSGLLSSRQRCALTPGMRTEV